MISAALDRTVFEGISPKPVAPSLGDPLLVDEKNKRQDLWPMARPWNRMSYRRNCSSFSFSTRPTKSCTHSMALLYLCGRRGRYRRSGKTSPSKFCIRRKMGPSVVPKAASLWCDMLAGLPSKSWLIDFATSARKLGFFPRNSAVSSLNVRQPT